MVSYLTTKDNFIRESSGLNPYFVQRIGISRKLALEIINYYKSLDATAQKQINFSQIKEELDIPNYEGYELFLDLKNDRVELKGDKLKYRNEESK